MRTSISFCLSLFLALSSAIAAPFEASVSGQLQVTSNSTGGPGTASSITQYGITWFFDHAYPVGQFCNGDWWVIGPVSIINITPQTTNVGGRQINGSMVNPGSAQIPEGYNGYDSLMSGPTFSFTGSGQPRYQAALNVAIGISPTTPRVFNPGTSLISAISWTSPSLPPSGSLSGLLTAAVLTVLPTAPPADAFRPPYSGTDKTIRHRESDLDYSALKNVAPAPGMPTFASMVPQFSRVWLDHMSSWSSRYMHPIDNMPDYGRDFTSLYGTGVLMLQTNATNTTKRDLFIRLVQIGIDDWGNVQNGGAWEGVGGQGSGRKMPILFAGRVLNYAPMLNVGTTHPSGYFGPGNANNRSQFGEDCQTFTVEATSGYSPPYNWSYGNYDSTFVGLPEWGNGHTHQPQNDSSSWTADSYRRCCTANAWVGNLLAVRMMGLRNAWNHQVLFDYQDRYMGIEPVGQWTRSWDTWQERMWDQYRSQY